MVGMLGIPGSRTTRLPAPSIPGRPGANGLLESQTPVRAGEVVEGCRWPSGQVFFKLLEDEADAQFRTTARVISSSLKTSKVHLGAVRVPNAAPAEPYPEQGLQAIPSQLDAAKREVAMNHWSSNRPGTFRPTTEPVPDQIRYVLRVFLG